MNRQLYAAIIVAVGVTACYQDDATHPGMISPTRVLLTDDPFPYDSVGSVNIYVTRIEASTTYPFDTTQANTWVEIAAPKKRFDLLTLQQGATAFVGQATLDAGRYSAIRMTINVDSSSIVDYYGNPAAVSWGLGCCPAVPGEMSIAAQVEPVLTVDSGGGAGGDIVIDFDLGRSFQYNLFGAQEYTFIPWLRAMNSAATGAIAGTVTAADISGQNVAPVANADVTVYGGNPNDPSTWYVAATSHTNSQGHYNVAYLLAGAYIVRMELPGRPWLAPAVKSGISVSVGKSTALSAQLPSASSGGASIYLTGPGTVGVGGRIALHAQVWDSTGKPLTNPVIAWASRNDSVAVVLDSAVFDSVGGDSLASVLVLGVGQGTTWIVATSGPLSDSLQVAVLPSGGSDPVATVTVTPDTLNLSVGDSTFLQAVLRDSVGVVLSNRQINWYQTDSTGVVDLKVTIGPTAVLKARRAGSTTVWAVSEGRWGNASVMVH